MRLARTPWGARFIRSVIDPEALTVRDYKAWIEANEVLTDADRAAIGAHVDRFAFRPLISVVMPVYRAPERVLREAIESVRAQLYPHWELCIADDATPEPGVWSLLQAYAAQDSRIKVIRRAENGHISAATNTALELATGEFVALLDHDDLLSERALYEVAAVLQQHPDLCGGIGIWDNQDTGTASAIKEAGKSDQVFLVTSGGGNKVGCENVEKGLFNLYISYNVPLQGDLLNQEIARLLMSQSPAGEIKTMYFNPLTMITKANVNQRNCWTLDDLK